MDDIILQARKEAVLGGLQRITNEVVALDRQQRELAELQNILSADADQIQDLANNIEIALTTLDVWARNAEMFARDPKRLNDFQESALSATKKAKDLAQLARQANTRAEALRQNWQLPLTSKGAVRQLYDEARSSRTKLTACQTWVSFLNEVRQTVRPLFEEHLDLLEGAAFRVVGYDDGVAQDADDLLMRLDKVFTVDAYLAVPSRSQAVRAVVARLVRMGFPGWSFWDLPLLAYEFGHIVALNDTVARELGRDTHPGTLQWRETILADAFATYTLGPAYAIAAIMLTLDPADTGAEGASPGGPQRAHLILEQLKFMTGAEGAFAQIAEQLGSAWHQVAPALTPESVEALKPWAMTARQLLEDELEIDKAPSYPESRWNTVSSWPDRLLEPNSSESLVIKEEDLLDLVNVAWVCRLRQPNRTKDITNAIDQLRSPTSEGRRRGLGSSPGRRSTEVD